MSDIYNKLIAIEERMRSSNIEGNKQIVLKECQIKTLEQDIFYLKGIVSGVQSVLDELETIEYPK